MFVPPETTATEASKPNKVNKPATPTPKQRLSYKEKRELESLPDKIEALEAEIAAIHDRMAQPDFYQQPSDVIATETAKVQELESELATAYERWEELEAIES